MLDKADKKMFYTFINDVGRVAVSLREGEAGAKDVEMERWFRRLAEDLEHVTADIRDTVDRL